MQEDITANYHGGNEASVEAHQSISSESAASLRQKVLRLISSEQHRGATSDEAEQALGLSHQSCSARFTELKALGRIVAQGKRTTRSGRKAFFYVTPSHYVAPQE